jgi:hypothetical protein
LIVVPRGRCQQSPHENADETKGHSDETYLNWLDQFEVVAPTNRRYEPLTAYAPVPRSTGML